MFKKINVIVLKDFMVFIVNSVSILFQKQIIIKNFKFLTAKCVIPCMNGGKCRGINKCRCPPGLGGDHCEIGRRQRSTCKKPCRNGDCMPTHKCRCNEGWFGRACNQSELIYCKNNFL